MKVKITQSFAEPMMTAFRPGEVLEVSKAQGGRWIKLGRAVAMESDEMPQHADPKEVKPKPEQAERAVKPRPETRAR